MKTVHNAIYHFSVTENTIYSADQFTEKNRLHILCKKRKGQSDFEAMAVCSTEDFEVFRRFRDLNVKLKAIRVYASMTGEQQKEILRQMSKKHPEEGLSETSRITSIDHKKLKFDLCAGSFSPEDRRHIRNLFLENSDKNKNDIKLSYLLGIDPCPPPLPAVSVSSLVQEMDQRIFALRQAKQQLVEKVLAHQPVLLVGGQRICALLAETLSRSLGLFLEEIDFSSLSSGLDLLGADATFDKANPGKILESMYSAGTSQMVFLLSHLERIGTTEDRSGSCENALLHIMSSNKRFEDRFLEKSVSTKDTIFIASATSQAAVPDALRQCFFVIELPEYSSAELVHLAQQFLIPHLLDETGIHADAVKFPEETLRCIVDRYCEDYSAGRMKEHLRSLLDRVAQEQAIGSLPIPYSVTCDFAESLLNHEVDETSPRLIVHRNREKYDPTVLKKLSELSAQLKNARLSMDERRILQERFALIAGLYPRFDTAGFNLKVFYETIRSTHEYMDTVADIIAGEFLCASKTPP
ncbi:MAG: hypothetical protein IIX70_00995, partial [Oscillospiraceae bacterium]|nr:hypothetical protein [Oscillospiraceae bacterium]